MDLDLGRIARAAAPSLAIWTVFVVLPTLLGAPQVICITPMAWLLALVAGLGGPVAKLRAEPPGKPLDAREGALAGLLVTAYEGALYVVWLIFFLRPLVRPDEVVGMWVVNAFLVGGGLAVGASLGLVGALLRRMGRKGEDNA